MSLHGPETQIKHWPKFSFLTQFLNLGLATPPRGHLVSTDYCNYPRLTIYFQQSVSTIVKFYFKQLGTEIHSPHVRKCKGSAKFNKIYYWAHLLLESWKEVEKLLMKTYPALFIFFAALQVVACALTSVVCKWYRTYSTMQFHLTVTQLLSYLPG